MVNLSLHKALEKADIENFRWHDLRHTWASWLVQSGVSLYALKEMGDWESIERVQKYAHLSSIHLHQHAKAIDEIMEKATILSHQKLWLKIPNQENTFKYLT